MSKGPDIDRLVELVELRARALRIMEKTDHRPTWLSARDLNRGLKESISSERWRLWVRP